MTAAGAKKHSWRRWGLAGAAFTLAAGLVVPAPAVAQDTNGQQQPAPRRVARMQHRGAQPMLRGMRQLNLTEEQRQQVRDTMQRHRDELKALGAQLRAARQALRTATDAEVVDQGAVRAATSQMAEAQAQGALLRAKIRQEVFALLTPEQQEQAKALRSEFEQRQEQRRLRMQQRLSQRPRVQPQ
jgi:Spy/CpxP family protein refolding chaperone